MKFIEVTPGVYRGSDPSSYADVVKLQNSGIKSILSLEVGFGDFFGYSLEAYDAAIANIRYVQLPLSNFFSPSTADVSRFFQAVTVLPKPLFIHCYAGVDRTGFMVALYRVRLHQWSPEMAWKECLAQGFHKYRFFWWKREFFKMCRWLA